MTDGEHSAQSPEAVEAHFAAHINDVERAATIAENATAGPNNGFTKGQVTIVRGILRRPTPAGADRFADTFYGAGELTREVLEQVREQHPPELPEPDIADGNLALRTLALSLFGPIRGIDRVQLRLFGADSLNDISSALSAKVIERMAYDLADSHYQQLLDHPRHIQHLHAVSQRVYDDDRQRVAWYAPKLEMFSRAVHCAVSFHEVLRSGERLSEGETQELAAANDALFEETRSLQKFGVKPAIALASSEPLNQWSVQRPHDLIDMSARSGIGITHRTAQITFGDSRAHFMGTDSTFTTTSIDVVRKTSETGARIVRLAADTDSDKPQTIGVSIFLGVDGELRGENGISLKAVSVANDLEGEYEQLRAELLAMYADLVTPVEIQKMIEQEEAFARAAESAGSADAEAESERPSRVMRRMILARATVLSVLSDEVEEMMQAEIDADIEETKRRRNGPARHRVAGTRRRMPSTFSASAERRALAWKEEKIELAPFGETYVKVHYRGDSNRGEVVGHAVGFRPESHTAQRRGERSTTPGPPRTQSDSSGRRKKRRRKNS